MPMSFLRETYSQTLIPGILMRVRLNVMIDGVDSLKKSMGSWARPDTTLVEYVTLPGTIPISLWRFVRNVSCRLNRYGLIPL